MAARDYDTIAAKLEQQVETPDLPPLESYQDEPRAHTNGQAHKEAAKPADKLPGINFADLKPHLADGHCIKGLAGKRALVLMIGAPGCGKTFLGGDLAVHIASGTPWRGHAVAQGLVVYVVLEGAASAENRFCASREVGQFKPGIPLILTSGPLNLRNPVDVLRLVELIRAGEAEHGVKVVAVFIDTLSRALCGGNENDSEDMGAGIAGADTIRLATGATVFLIHHTGKDESRGARGHSSLKGAIDTEIEVTKTGSVHLATVTKQRDLVSGARYAFMLHVVELGRDADGDPVTTCVVKPAEVPQTERKAPAGKNQAALLAALQEWQRAHDGQTHISSIEFRSIANTQGIKGKRLPEIVESLTKCGWLTAAVGGFTLSAEQS